MAALPDRQAALPGCSSTTVPCGFASCELHYGTDEQPDREPSVEQEEAWDEQYDGTSFGA